MEFHDVADAGKAELAEGQEGAEAPSAASGAAVVATVASPPLAVRERVSRLEGEKAAEASPSTGAVAPTREEAPALESMSYAAIYGDC